MEHKKQVQLVFLRACKVLRLAGFKFRVMARRVPITKNKSYTIGRINLKTKSLSIDIYTAKMRKPKKISAILAVLAHELAHFQKPPYRQIYKGRAMNRIHYPRFYKQVKRNIKKFKKDKILQQYYTGS